MPVNQVPTSIQAGNPGSLFAAPATVTLDHGAAYLIPSGDYYLYASDADMDLEIITATVPTWTKLRDGDAAIPGFYLHSDGVSLRLHNSHASTDGETAKLIQVG